MADAPLSAATGKPMVRDVRPVEISYHGRSRTVDMPGWFCDASGESIHSRDDMQVSDLALTSLKAEAMSLAGPEEVRDLRSRIGLSRIEADEVIGGEPGLFEKYENGQLLVSRPITHLLRLLARHPDDIRRLRAEHPDAETQSGASQVDSRNRTATTINP